MNRFNAAVFQYAARGAWLAAALVLWPAEARLAMPASPAEGAITLREGWAIQSSEKVNAGGAEISRVGYDASGWYKTSVPKTVFAALVEHRVYPDPYFGMNLRSVPGVTYPIGSEFSNQEMPDDSPYAKPWWYRAEFLVPASYKGKAVWLEFRGINYRAEIWLNGQRVASADEVAGAFRRYEFNVTKFVQPGAKSALALGVTAPLAGELGITFVDWNPTPPDKDMGLWQEVVLRASGPVAVRHAAVEAKLDMPGRETARLTVRAELKNASAKTVSGTLRGRIVGADTPIEFSQKVELAAGENREVALTPEEHAGLAVKKPKLWWPYQMGKPYLHTLHLDFVTAEGSATDRQSVPFGIVEWTSELAADGGRLFRVNGEPVLIRGGGWTPDMMLRVDPARRKAEFRYVKEMGLNTIRLEGKLEDENFFEMADREGIMVMAGWCCCDAWEKWGKWGDENRHVSVYALREQALRLRGHPSVFVWLNGSDNPPPPDREQAYIDVLKAVSWPRPLISSATAKKTDLTGATGVKMTGPYEYVSPDYWLQDTKRGGAFAFNTETSPGPAIPPVESLQKMFPGDKLWPINEFWDFHSGGGQFKNIQVYAKALEERYGKAQDLNDFVWKSQATAYEGERAMFEAYGRNKYRATGVIQWMLNNAWPGLIWHLYDYFLRPGGGYFGSKVALEPVHVQFCYDDRSIAIVSNRREALHGLKVEAKIYDVGMKERFSQTAAVDVPADGVATAFTLPEPENLSTTYFASLRLYSSKGEILSRNFYWLSTKQDVLQWEKSAWYYTPLSAYADLTGLQSLPKVELRARLHAEPSAEEGTARVTLENPGKSLAFLTRLRILRGKGGEEVLPIFWEENYLSLLPGEKRSLVVHYAKKDLGAANPVLAVDGWNVAPAAIAGQ